jgi:hypothetical protein
MGLRDLLQQGTCLNDDDRLSQIKALEKSGFSKREIFALIRDKLTVLNAKASTLLTFNAMALASLSIWASNTPVADPSPLARFHLTLDFVYMLFLVSSFLSLFNVSIHWSVGNPLLDDQLVAYLRARDRRTKLHRVALAIAVASVLGLFVASSMHVAAVASHVLGYCVDSEGFWCALAPIDR